jgi:O-antigen/teichoic acid export membrane protein
MSKINLLKNMSWLTLISGVERVAAVLQTVLVARALGMTDYGIYGLIFGTIGLAASVAGLQMGLTATVFVARYRDAEKGKAAFVIAFANRFGFGVALLFLLCTIPFAGAISAWLVGPSLPEMATIAGCLLVVISIISGVQDGIIQGFEEFRSIALARLVTTAVTLACIYPAGIAFGLLGVMAVVLVGLIVKYALLSRKLAWHVRRNGLPAEGSGLFAKDLILGFIFPSMLVSLLVGTIGWSGTFVLSRQVDGFDALAVVNTGLQWRGPIFLLASVISGAAIPAISRHYQRMDHTAIQGMHRTMLLFNAGFALLVSVALAALSPLILLLYGPGFSDGAFVFSLVVVSSVPQVIAGVYLQHLVAKGQMWQQLLLHLWLVVPLSLGYATMVPRFHGVGFAITHLFAWSIFAVALALILRVTPRLSNNSSIG